MHTEKHPLAGKTVRINLFAPHEPARADARIFVELRDQQFVVEDWWDHLTGGSWGDAEGNPACLKYAMRVGFSDPSPNDDEVVYGHVVGGLGNLLHESELGDVVEEEPDGVSAEG